MKIILFLVLLYISPLGATSPKKNPYICYKSSLVKLRITYEMFDSGFVVEPGCSFHFIINSINPSHVYFSRRWQSIEFCEGLAKKWLEHKAQRKKVCLAGPLGNPEADDGKRVFERSGFWEVLKFGGWCESFFEGYCDDKWWSYPSYED